MPFAPFPPAGYLADGTRTEGDMKVAFEEWRLATEQTAGHGDGLLQLESETQLILRPRDGNRMIVGERNIMLPAAGLTVTNVGLTANRDYWVALVDPDNDGQVRLQLVEAQAPFSLAADPASGVMTVLGTPYANRATMVGNTRTTATGTFATTTTSSWFHQLAGGGGGTITIPGTLNVGGLVSNGNIVANQNLILANDKWLYGTETGGTTRAIFTPQGSDNNVHLGTLLPAGRAIYVGNPSVPTSFGGDVMVLKNTAKIEAQTTPGGAVPRFRLHYPNIVAWDFAAMGNANLHISPGNPDDWALALSSSGQLYLKQGISASGSITASGGITAGAAISVPQGVWFNSGSRSVITFDGTYTLVGGWGSCYLTGYTHVNGSMNATGGITLGGGVAMPADTWFTQGGANVSLYQPSSGRVLMGYYNRVAFSEGGGDVHCMRDLHVSGTLYANNYPAYPAWGVVRAWAHVYGSFPYAGAHQTGFSQIAETAGGVQFYLPGVPSGRPIVITTIHGQAGGSVAVTVQNAGAFVVQSGYNNLTFDVVVFG